MYICSEQTRKRLVAHRSETAGQLDIESRCSLECPPHGKADCAYTTVIGEPNSQKSTQLSRNKKPKTLWKVVRAASCVELLSVVLLTLQDSFLNWGSHFFWFSMLHTRLEHETARFYCHVFWCSCVRTAAAQTHFHMVSVCTANYLEQKECQDHYKPFSNLVSIFDPMMSFTIRMSLWHSSLIWEGKKEKGKLKNLFRRPQHSC